MKITTKYINDYEYLATTENGHSAKIDMKSEGKANQAPMEMVLSALTGCIAVEVPLMLQKRRKTLVDLEIEARAKRKEKPPKSFTAIHLHFNVNSPDANQEEVEKIIALALDKYCSVADSLKADIMFTSEVKG